jgi:preprotein translocase subunit SecG
MSAQTIQILQLIIAILLIASILLQQRGSGLGEAFGGSSAIFRTKRGAEKIIFRTSIVLIIALIGLAFAALFIGK